MAGPKPRRVVVLCYPQVELLDVAGPTNVLTAVTRLFTEARGYDVRLCALRKGPVETGGGVALYATHSVRGLRGDLDTLIVPGGFDVHGLAADLVPHIERLAGRARRVVGVCTGTLLLGEAGLLARRRVVTHWAACDLLAARQPECSVERDAIFVRDGRVWTSAGVTAGMDLALALVEEDLGADRALEVARWLVMYLRRPGGQTQFSAPLRAQRAESGPIRGVCEWVSANLAKDLSVPALAARAGMSERNFARLFKAQVGETPAAWVQRMRIEAARRALLQSSATAREVARACGFDNPETLHRAFRRATGTSPLLYRARFSAAAPHASDRSG